MAVNEFVLVDIPKYAGEWPQLCKIVSICDDADTVRWYKGSKTTAWTPCTRRTPGGAGEQNRGWRQYPSSRYGLLCSS